MKFYNRDRGSTIMGTTGTVLVDRDGYEIYDLDGKKTRRVQSQRASHLILRPGRRRLHDRCALRKLHRRHPQRRKTPRAHLLGNVAVTMLQLSNIAWEVNRESHLDPTDGKIQNDPKP